MMIWKLESLLRHAAECQTELPDGRWVPARPVDGPRIARISAAWAVLVGRADAVTWPGQPTESEGK